MALFSKGKANYFGYENFKEDFLRKLQIPYEIAGNAVFKNHKLEVLLIGKVYRAMFDENNEICGTLFKIPIETLPYLDKAFKAPHFYKKTTIEVKLKDGTLDQAIAYFYHNSEI